MKKKLRSEKHHHGILRVNKSNRLLFEFILKSWLEKNQDFEKVTDEDGVGKKLVYKFGKRFREDEQRKQKAIEDLSNYNY